MAMNKPVLVRAGLFFWLSEKRMLNNFLKWMSCLTIPTLSVKVINLSVTSTFGLSDFFFGAGKVILTVFFISSNL